MRLFARVDAVQPFRDALGLVVVQKLGHGSTNQSTPRQLVLTRKEIGCAKEVIRHGYGGLHAQMV